MNKAALSLDFDNFVIFLATFEIKAVFIASISVDY